jgi:excisionase family DNA binding protein
MPRGFSILLTVSQAAERLGVPAQRVLALIAGGQLRAAAQDEDGRVLIREHRVQELAADLAVRRPAVPKRGRAA